MRESASNLDLSRMKKIQLDHLRQHGLSVTTGTLQGLPVLLLALVSTTTAALSCSPAPAHAAAGTEPVSPTGTRLFSATHPAGDFKARQPRHLKRPPHRPFRS
jgi:hypothetical protein